MTAVRTVAQRRRPRAARPRRPPAPRRRLPGLWPPVGRRILLAVVLLAVLIFPVTSLVSGGAPQQAACRGCGSAPPAVAQRWAVPLTGAWTAGGAGTVPPVCHGDAVLGGGVGVDGVGVW